MHFQFKIKTAVAVFSFQESKNLNCFDHKKTFVDFLTNAFAITTYIVFSQ